MKGKPAPKGRRGGRERKPGEQNRARKEAGGAKRKRSGRKQETRAHTSPRPGGPTEEGAEKKEGKKARGEKMEEGGEKKKRTPTGAQRQRFGGGKHINQDEGKERTKSTDQARKGPQEEMGGSSKMVKFFLEQEKLVENGGF